jgi:hypothetical protein
MGFFSWKTADTDESIMNRFTDECRPVYMLMPKEHGPHVFEPAYEGYGKFGGVDAYAWLARMNAPEEATSDVDKNRGIGLHLFFSEARSSIKYPIKFSFNKDAVYEELPASGDCPLQGFFGRSNQPCA